MSKLVLFLMLNTLFVWAFAQAKKVDVVSRNPTFKENSIKYYRISDSTKWGNSDSHQSFTSVKKLASVKVVKVYEDSILMEWDCTTVAHESRSTTPHEFQTKMSQVGCGPRIQYVVDKRGAIKRINNTSDIVAKVERSLLTMREGDSMSNLLADQLRQRFKLLLSSKNFITDVVLRDIYLFHRVFGDTLLESEPGSGEIDHSTDIISIKSRSDQWEDHMTVRAQTYAEFHRGTLMPRKLVYMTSSKRPILVESVYEVVEEPELNK